MPAPSSFFRYALAATLVISCALASRLAAARDCAYYSGNGPGVYNLKNGLDGKYAGAVDTANLGGLRLGFRIDTQQQWDQALFDQYDAYLAAAKEHGLDVMGIVLYESTTQGQASWNSGFDSTGYSAYVQLFVDTAKLLFNRYGDQIKYWEIWNEPNAWTNSNYQNDPTHAGGFYILPQVYAKILAETYVQANAVITSKHLHLITGGLLAHNIGGGFSPATDYAQQVYANGVWDWMQTHYGRRYPWDGFGYHIYIDQGGATTEANVLKFIDAIQQFKVSVGDYVPLWITEFGWSTKSAVSEATQAQNLDMALKVFESRGDVARTFVFKVDDYDGWGIFRGDWTAKPSVGVLQTHDHGCTHLPKAPPPQDAGADGAAPPPPGDAGPVMDASAPPRPATDDAGTPPANGATPENGTTSGDSGGGGCGCRAARARSASGGVAAATLALIMVLRKRRSRRQFLRAPRR